jgi:hypothetical protein
MRGAAQDLTCGVHVAIEQHAVGLLPIHNARMHIASSIISVLKLLQERSVTSQMVMVTLTSNIDRMLL